MMPVMKFSAGYIWPGMFFWDSPNIVNDYSLLTINEIKKRLCVGGHDISLCIWYRSIIETGVRNKCVWHVWWRWF